MRAPLALIALVVLNGCTVLLDFDPDGRPCDALGQCEPGFACVEGRCLRGAAPVSCEDCAVGGCIPGTTQCLPDTCEHRLCPPAHRCEEGTDAGARCLPIQQGELGGPCYDDAFCSGGPVPRYCLRGAVPVSGTGALKTGVCVERCEVSQTCATPGATCRAFALGPDAGTTRLCLPEDTLTGCAGRGPCERAGFVCTVFGHPSVGVLTACDVPLDGGVGPGEPCSVGGSADGGDRLCGNGLCLPPGLGSLGFHTCSEPCGSDSCTVGSCVLASVEAVGSSQQLSLCR